MNVPEEFWRFDLSIARGLSYYTGPVFETFLDDLPSIGSVFSGGRYDDLVARFGDATFPATGASVGVDRLFVALEKLGRLKPTVTMTQVLVTTMDQVFMSDYLAVTGELRQAGVRTSIWFGAEPTFKAQLAFATRTEIPVVIIIGSDERAAGEVMVKDMRNRTQTKVSRTEVVAAVQQILKQ
jgi:histidyl-tRNA synthetase